MSALTAEEKSQALEFFSNAQKTLAKKLEEIDGQEKFSFNSWDHKEGGGGKIGLMRGNVVEKTGVNFSAVSGKSYPNIEKSYKDKPFFATGISTITHMRNPHAPIGHMNVRMIDIGEKFWFGGGADLTPCFEYKEDTELFHESLKQACDKFSQEAYNKYSKW